MRGTGGPWHCFVSLGILFLVGCGGCNNGEGENLEGDPNAKPFAGLSIDVAVPAIGDLESVWQKDLSEWSFQNGTEHRVKGYNLPEEGGRFVDAVADLSQDGKEWPEVLLLPWAAVPELIAAGALAEIPDPLKDKAQLNWLGYFSGLRNGAATLAGKPRVIPVSCPVLVCYYRQDLLEKAGLEPPDTWADYQQLLETSSEWAPNLTAAEPWGEPFRASMFLARAASVAKHPEQYSFCFDLIAGEPLIDNPGFVEALAQSRSALAMMPEAVKTYSPDDCRREFLAGRAALAIGYETGRNQDVTRSEDLQVGIGRLPGSRRIYNTAINEWVEFGEDDVHRVTFTGFTGWVLGVSGGLDETKNNAAWELARYMAIDQLPASYPREMLSPCRDSQTQSPTEWTGTNLTTSESEQYVAAVREALQTDQLAMELPLLGRAKFRAALTKGLSEALKSETDAQVILSNVAKDWREIANQLGKEKVAKSYQQSLE